MWLATKHGFFSAVCKEGAIHFRARIRKDLEQLCRRVWKTARPAIQRWPEADYRFRVILSPEQFFQVMNALTQSVDYSNFKSCIHESEDQQDKLPAYSALWGALYSLQSKHERRTD